MQTVLRRGDIVLVSKAASGVAIAQGSLQFFKYLTVAPALISLARNSSKPIAIQNANFVHSLIYAGGTGHSHSTNNGTKTELFNPKNGDVIFRANDPAAAERVADTAKRWANEKGGEYSKRKAIVSALGSSKFGSQAKARAEHYRTHVNTPGGPPAKDASEKKHWFCSMFVIACWQAVLTEQETSDRMALDARYATPMTLGTYLTNNVHWERIIVGSQEG